MKKNVILLMCLALMLSLLTPSAFARGGGYGAGRGSSKSSTRSVSKGRSSAGSTSNSNTTYVRGYTKKNGTYVAPHRRTKPDKTKSNNWSSKGNVNPDTGKNGTKDSYK